MTPRSTRTFVSAAPPGTVSCPQSRERRGNSWRYHTVALVAVAPLLSTLFGIGAAVVTPQPRPLPATPALPKAAPVPTQGIGERAALPAPAPPPVPSGPSVRVSTTTPRRSEEFWVTVTVPPAAETSGRTPYLRFRNPQGRRSRMALEPNGRPGEWTRHFGLDEAGLWRGVALYRTGKRRRTMALPPIQVLP